MENLNKSTPVNSDAFIEFMGKALNLRPDQVIERVYRNTSEDMLGLNKAKKNKREGDPNKWEGDPMADFEDARWARQDEGPVGALGALPKMMNTSIGPVSEASVDRAEARADAKRETQKRVRAAKREGRANGFEASFVDKSGGRARLPGRDTGMLKAPEEDDEDPRDAKRRREEAVANRVEQELQQSFSPRKLAQFGKSVNNLDIISHRMTIDFGR